MKARAGWFIAAGAALIVAAAPAAEQAQQPTFRASTDLVAIDAAVVDKDGRPVPDLGPEDFAVTVDGKPRRVVSAAFVSQEAPGAAVWTFPPAHSSNEGSVGSRLILLAVDQSNIATGGARLAMKAAGQLVDRLAPGDRVGVVAFPHGVDVPFTTDRARVVEALQRIIGTAPRPLGMHYFSLAEAVSIERRDFQFWQQVVDRECAIETGQGRDLCERLVEGEARGWVSELRDRSAASASTLRSILNQLAKIEAAKVLIWISEGLPAFDQHGRLEEIATRAIEARTIVYAVHIDPSLLPDASLSHRSPTIVEDRLLLVEGLEVITGTSRGAVLQTGAGAEGVFTRIARELSAYYVVTIEPDAIDRDGRPHEVQVRSTKPGITVRARRRFVIRDSEGPVLSRDQQIRALLQAPVLTTDLPMRVATYPMVRDGSRGVQVVVGSDIGRSLGAAEEVAVGFAVFDANGKVAASGFDLALLDPLDETAGAALQHTTAAALPAGSYTLRVAAVDAGGRKGSVEHAFAVPAVSSANPLSSLVLAPAHEGRLRVAALATAGTRGLQAYAELDPGAGDEWLRAAVTLEVLDAPGAAPLARVAGQIGRGRESHKTAVQAEVPVALLPEGEYLARLSLQSGSRVLASRERPFVLAAPVATLVRRALFADEAERLAGFTPADVLAPAVLRQVLDRALQADGATAPDDPRAAAAARALQGALPEAAGRLPRDGESVTAAMVRGLLHLERRELEPAAAQFRAALRLAPEFLPAIVYLGSCYAAGNRPREAAGAWQTALVSEFAEPLVFKLAADAWVRAGEFGQARDLLEEAFGRWPSDRDFARRLALARAIEGEPLQALAALGTAPGDLPLRTMLAAAAAIEHRDRRDEVRAALDAIAATSEGAEGGLPPLAQRWRQELQNPE